MSFKKTLLIPTFVALLVVLGSLVFKQVLMTFALVVLCLLVGAWVVYFLALLLQAITPLRWGELDERWKRFIQFLLLTSVVVLANLVVYMFKRLAVPKSFHGTLGVEEILGALFFILVIAWIGFFVYVWYRSTNRSWTKKVIYYCSTSIFILLFLSIELSKFSTYFGDQEWWYHWLLKQRENPVPPGSEVVLLDFEDGWPGEQQFIQLLSMLDRYEPTVIAFAFHPSITMELDSTVVAKLKSAIVHAHLVLTDLERGRFDVAAGEMTVEYGGLVIRRDHPAMYFSPNNDLAKAILDDYSKTTAKPVGKFTLPLTEDNVALINYYSGDFRSSFGFHQNLRYFGEKSIRTYLLRSVYGGGHREFLRVNFARKQIEQSVNRDKYDFSLTADLRELKNKIVIVNVPSFINGNTWITPWRSTGYIYATIVQNILDKNFIYQPKRIHQLLVAAIVLALLSLMYAQINPWKALAGSMVLNILLVAGLVALFVKFQIYVSPTSLIVTSVGSLVFFFPYEITAERRRLLEERTRLSTELRAARDMQIGLMPKEDPVVQGFDISGICIPANEVGGDFFDYVWMDDKKTKLGIAVADVSGKAMKAAITAVMTSGMIYRELGGNQLPRAILQRINKPMFAKLSPGTFTAMSFAVIDTKKQHLTFSNAGQMRPILKRGAKTEYIMADGLPLGVQEETTYREAKIKLRKGDVVIFYTDGINEAMNEKQEQYELERLESAVRNLKNEMTARQVIDSIVDEVKAFVGSGKQHDDMTVVVVKVM
jgi:serine phosphatase RsbU (regulator of sigma subunit)